jgi:hypothetical protein
MYRYIHHNNRADNTTSSNSTGGHAALLCAVEKQLRSLGFGCTCDPKPTTRWCVRLR